MTCSLIGQLNQSVWLYYFYHYMLARLEVATTKKANKDLQTLYRLLSEKTSAQD